MKYKTFVTIIIIALIAGCNPTPKPNGESDPNDKSDTTKVEQPKPDLTVEEPKPDLRSFAYRTKNYDMYSVQESKE